LGFGNTFTAIAGFVACLVPAIEGNDANNDNDEGTNEDERTDRCGNNGDVTEVAVVLALLMADAAVPDEVVDDVDELSWFETGGDAALGVDPEDTGAGASVRATFPEELTGRTKRSLGTSAIL